MALSIWSTRRLGNTCTAQRSAKEHALAKIGAREICRQKVRKCLHGSGMSGDDSQSRVNLASFTVDSRASIRSLLATGGATASDISQNNQDAKPGQKLPLCVE